MHEPAIYRKRAGSVDHSCVAHRQQRKVVFDPVADSRP